MSGRKTKGIFSEELPDTKSASGQPEAAVLVRKVSQLTPLS